MRLSTQPLPHDLNQCLCIQHHHVIHGMVSSSISSITWQILPIRLHPMLYPNLMPDKMDRCKGRNIIHFNNEQVCTNWRMFTSINLTQRHGRRGRGCERTSLSKNTFIG